MQHSARITRIHQHLAREREEPQMPGSLEFPALQKGVEYQRDLLPLRMTRH